MGLKVETLRENGKWKTFHLYIYLQSNVFFLPLYPILARPTTRHAAGSGYI